MCGSILDNVFGIDPPQAPAPQPVKVFSQSNNPSAVSSQDDLTPDGDGISNRLRKKGRSALRVNAGGSAGGSTGLNIPS